MAVLQSNMQPMQATLSCDVILNLSPGEKCGHEGETRFGGKVSPAANVL